MRHGRDGDRYHDLPGKTFTIFSWNCDKGGFYSNLRFSFKDLSRNGTSMQNCVHNSKRKGMETEMTERLKL